MGRAIPRLSGFSPCAEWLLERKPPVLPGGFVVFG